MVEGRPVTKENAVESSTGPTLSGRKVYQGLHGVREEASNPDARFDARPPRGHIRGKNRVR